VGQARVVQGVSVERGLGRTRLSALLTVCGLAAAGCSGADVPKPPPDGPSSSSAVDTTAGPTVPCAHDLGADAPDGGGYRLVLDAVAVPTGTLVPQESGEPGWLFAKSGLVVRASTPVDVAVAPDAAGRVRIGWGSPGPEATTIHVPACPSGSGWLAFAGGYSVRTPACVPLIVRAHGKQERVDVSVGVAC
jgi:hypothetical protein